MTLVIEPFYRHASLGPGAPLTHLTGSGEGDGFYDWAGRRLFLPDGEPDPACPGAYRYQHNPTSCDVDAPDSDPRSPRYEPAHLRHQPGDTWLIDHDRPRDPYDPGPYGSPGWYQDQRTGRHRRDETPDPLPAEGWEPPKEAWYPGIEARTGQPVDDRERSSQSTRSRTGSRPRPQPHNRFWSEADQQQADEDEYRFDRLRENAWDDFMIDSEDLAAAHHEPSRSFPRRRSTALERESGLAWALWIRMVQWLIGMVKTLAIPTMPNEPTQTAPRTALASIPEPEPVPAPRTEHSPPDPWARPPACLPAATMARALSGARRARAEQSTRAADFALTWERRFDAARSAARDVDRGSGPISRRQVPTPAFGGVA